MGDGLNALHRMGRTFGLQILVFIRGNSGRSTKRGVIQMKTRRAKNLLHALADWIVGHDGTLKLTDG